MGLINVFFALSCSCKVETRRLTKKVNGKTYGKIFPFGENHLVVLAKKSSKKHGVQKGMMMFRLVDSSEGTMIIKENRAFKEFESDAVFDTMQSMGIDMMRMMGDSFLVEHSN